MSATGPESVLGLDEDELVACVACGLCLPHCPTYRVTGREIASPRGRIAAMRAVERAGAPLDASFAAAMDACIQCRGCEAACPSSVPFGRLMERTQAALHERRPARGVRRLAEFAAYRLVLPNHRVLVALTWVLAALARVRLVPRRFGLPPLRRRSLRPLVAPTAAVPSGRADGWLLTGCVMDAWLRDTHRSVLEVAEAMGQHLELPGRGAACCGALHVHAGRHADARRLARRVIASMPGRGPVVVDSAGCGAAMKDYGRLLGTDEARAFSARVVDFSEWVVAQGVPSTRPTGRRIVIQDPCHLRHVQRAHDAVRTVLAGCYELAETDDDGMCCGAGGVYSLRHAEISGAVRDRKVAALRRAAGSTRPEVASANPGCAMHLTAAGLDVRHPADLLAAALEGRRDG